MNYEVITDLNKVEVGDKIVNRDAMITDTVTGLVHRDGERYGVVAGSRVLVGCGPFILREIPDETDDRVHSVYFPKDQEEGTWQDFGDVTLRIHEGKRYAYSIAGYPLYVTFSDEWVHWTVDPDSEGVTLQPHWYLALS